MLDPLTLGQWHTALRNKGIIESNIHGLVMFFTNHATRLRIPCTYALLELGVTDGHGPNLMRRDAASVTREYWNASEALRKGLNHCMGLGLGIESVAWACLAFRFCHKERYRELMLMDPDALRFLAKSADSAEINTAYALAICVRHVLKEVHNDYQSNSP